MRHSCNALDSFYFALAYRAWQQCIFVLTIFDGLGGLELDKGFSKFTGNIILDNLFRLAASRKVPEAIKLSIATGKLIETRLDHVS